MTPIEAPTRTARLVCVLGKLIEYGRELAHTLRQGVSPESLPTLIRNFGTGDIAVILAYVTRAVYRAVALRAWAIERADGPDRRYDPASVPARRKPRGARPATPDASDVDPLLALLPTPQEILAEVRRRPMGAVLADIGRDLGILPGDPLWRELSSAIIENDGNLGAMLKEMNERARSATFGRRRAAAAPRTAAAGAAVKWSVVAASAIDPPAVAPPVVDPPAVAPPAVDPPAVVGQPGVASPPLAVVLPAAAAPPAIVTPPAVVAPPAVFPSRTIGPSPVDPPAFADPAAAAPVAWSVPSQPLAPASGAGPP